MAFREPYADFRWDNNFANLWSHIDGSDDDCVWKSIYSMLKLWGQVFDLYYFRDLMEQHYVIKLK